MLNIGQFFKKIQNKHTKELFIRSVVKDVIQKYVGVEVPVESISFKSDTVVLQGVSQTAKSQIFIKKQAIVQEVNSKQNIRRIVDVR